MKDFVKLVAAAYGTGDPRTHEIANQALRDLEELRREIYNQSSMIKELVARAPKQPETKPAAPIAAAAVDETNGAKLSEEMKEQIRKLAIQEWERNKRWYSAQELVDRLTALKISLGVAQPVPAVGTVLAAIRKQFEAQLEGRASALATGKGELALRKEE